MDSIRCEVHTAEGQRTIYNVSCRLPAEASDKDRLAAAQALLERLKLEMSNRKDSASEPATLFAVSIAKGWGVHLHAAGQWP
jgi:hypothetical protein